MQKFDLETLNPLFLKLWKIYEDKAISTPDELATIENEIECKLPEDYKSYMLEYGMLFDNSIQYGWIARYDMGNSIAKKTIEFGNFYSTKRYDLVDKYQITVLSRYYTLIDKVSIGEDYREMLIPPKMLPIAVGINETTGDILMDFSKENYGQIWYWEFSFDEWGSDENQMLGYIAPDFTTFIKLFQKIDIEDGNDI